MKTQQLKISENQLIQIQILPAVKILKESGIVAFPTETVYGLGGNALNIEAIEKIYKAKGRPSDNPLILHVSSIEMLEKIAYFDHPDFKILIQNFWPGPITFVLNKKPIVPSEVTGGLDTVAVRMPFHPIALMLIEACGFPIAAPSANLSGRPSPTTADMVYEDLNERIPLILDSGNCSFGLESTVLDLTSDKPRILRPGAITYEVLKQFLPDLEVCQKNEEKTLSPGLKYPHYKPKMPVILYSKDDQVDRIIAEKQSQKPACIGLSNHPHSSVQNFCFTNMEDLAQRLYYLFHLLEKEGFDLILIKKIDETGLGTALMNRIIKAADLIL